MGTTTTNYSFGLPTIDGDADSWGTQLNANWTKTDGLLSGSQDLSTLSVTTSVTLKGQGDLILADADSSHSVSLQAAATIGTSYTLTLPAADGSNGQVLATDGSGNLSFTAISDIADADGDTKIQVEEGADDDTIRFDTAGSERAIISSGGGVGIATTDLGSETLSINKVGSNSYGSIQIRRSDTDADNNGGYLAFAQQGDASTSWVGLAGWDNSSNRTVYLGGGGWGVEEATAVVLYAGAYDAGSGGATESARFQNTFITLKRATTVQDSGVPLKVDSTNSNTFKQRFEDNGTVVGYLGANSSVCFYAGDSSGNGRFFVSQNGSEVKQISSATTAYYRFQTNGTDRNYLYQSGGNEIGFLSTTGGWNFKVDNSGNATATGNVTAFSDIRLKDDIKPIENALARVSQLEGVEYTRKSTGQREMGFVAQSVEQHEPLLVDTVDTLTSETDEAFADLRVMKYQNTVALLVQAIKEQQAIIDANQLDVLQLKDEIKQLKAVVGI